MGEKLHHARLELNLSQSELAVMVGISDRTISKYERNLSIPRTDILCELASVLKVSLSYLLEDEVDDTQKDRDHDFFLAEVRDRFGDRAVPAAREMLASTQALHAGGSVTPEAMVSFKQAMMVVFIDIMEETKEMYAPKQRKKRKLE